MATRVGFRVPTGPRGTWRECMHAPNPHTLWVEAWRGAEVRVRVRSILGDTPRPAVELLWGPWGGRVRKV